MPEETQIPEKEAHAVLPEARSSGAQLRDKAFYREGVRPEAGTGYVHRRD